MTDADVLVFDGGLIRLPFPLEDAGGFAVEARLIDDFKVRIFVHETEFTGYIELSDQTIALYQEQFAAFSAGKVNGARLLNTTGIISNGIAPAVFGDHECMLIRQAITGLGGSVDGLGYLESFVTYDETGYVVLDQRAVKAQ